MERINTPKVVAFRHQLWLEHVEVIEEFVVEDATFFVLKTPCICPWGIQNLIRIAPFSILNLYHDGMLRMHLRISVND